MFNYDMQLHLNLRISAIFKDKIYSEKGTIFTTQIQEFINDGDIFMSTNFNKSNFLSSISNYNNKKLLDILKYIDNIGCYVLQVKPKSRVKGKNCSKINF